MGVFHTLIDWLFDEGREDDPVYYTIKLILVILFLALVAWLGPD